MIPRKQIEQPKKTTEEKKEKTPSPLFIHSIMKLKRSQQIIADRKSFCTIL